MNKSYVSVWNESLGSWVAASEHTRARSKRSKSRVVADSIVAALGVIVGCSGVAEADVTNPIGTYGNFVVVTSLP
ncbi:ESPR domain-containing protein [Paraburkholderia sp. 31.1]|uniref:ESPR domain-containing protein n=1 Tax=Paraburkholderia sp. 31.1 TaxID=2615205 RepID=UPI00165545B5|nr:ESPR domain-containing protein [Paraburkholderia sp. 31.1]